MSAEALNGECAVVHGWRFTRFTEGQFAEFSSAAKRRAISEVNELRAAVDPFEYREMLSAVIADCAAGSYRWGHFGAGPGVARFLMSSDGVELATLMALSKLHPDVTAQDVRKRLEEYPEEMGKAIKECVSIPPS